MPLNERSGPITSALVRSVKTPGKYHGRGTELYLRVEAGRKAAATPLIGSATGEN